MILTTYPDGTITCADSGLEVSLAPDGTLAHARLHYASGTVRMTVTPPPDDAPERERIAYAEAVTAWQAVARQAAPCPPRPSLRRTA